jgi:hypothetical protein
VAGRRAAKDQAIAGEGWSPGLKGVQLCHHWAMTQRVPGHRRKVPIVAALILTAIVGLFGLVVLLPPAIVGLDLAGRVLDGTDYVSAVVSARTSVLQALGGLAVIVGAYAAWRRLVLNAEEVRVLHDGQLTDRFLRAVDQLGNNNIDVRVGGIFALARVARNSPEDANAVIATLSAFIRGHSPWPPESSSRFPDDIPTDTIWSLAAREPDVQIALTTLGKVSHALDGEWIRLQNTDLRAARLSEYNLDYALLVDSRLRGSRAWRVSLVGADLRRCDFRDAELRHADLRYASLFGADLRGAELEGAKLDGAEADESTRWPTDDFDWRAKGVVMVTNQDWRAHPPGRRLHRLRALMPSHRGR